MDIKTGTKDYIFSYRVAGICIIDGKVLLQKPSNETGYAFPGGHVMFGETTAETLEREFLEEVNAKVKVGKLKWIQENFFPLNGKKWHQICLYYLVEIDKDTFPLNDVFNGVEQMDEKKFTIQFYWIPISELSNIEVYPEKCKDFIQDIDGEIKHFISKK